MSASHLHHSRFTVGLSGEIKKVSLYFAHWTQTGIRLLECAAVNHSLCLWMLPWSFIFLFCWAHNGITHYMVIFVSGISQLMRDRIGRGWREFTVTKCILLNLPRLRNSWTCSSFLTCQECVRLFFEASSWVSFGDHFYFFNLISPQLWSATVQCDLRRLVLHWPLQIRI